MPKHAVMLNHHHHAANLNDDMMLTSLLIQKVSLFTRRLKVAPQHKSPPDKVGGQCNNNPESNAGYSNNPADDVGFHDLASCVAFEICTENVLPTHEVIWQVKIHGFGYESLISASGKTAHTPLASFSAISWL